MYFLLHHSTGALVLTAEDRDSAVSWSSRQLGAGSKAASVLEIEECISTLWIEHSGTGVERALGETCEARLSFMADSVQRVNGFGSDSIQIEEWYRVSDVSGSEGMVH